MHFLVLLAFCCIEIQLYSSEKTFANFFTNFFVKKNTSLPVQEKKERSIKEIIQSLQDTQKLDVILDQYQNKIDDNTLSDQECLQLMYILEYIDIANYNIFKKNKKNIYEKIKNRSQTLYYASKEYIYFNKNGIGRKIINNINNANNKIISIVEQKKEFLNQLEANESFIFKKVQQQINQSLQTIISKLKQEKELLSQQYRDNFDIIQSKKTNLQNELSQLNSTSPKPLPDDHESLKALINEKNQYTKLVQQEDATIQKEEQDLETWNTIQKLKKLLKEGENINEEIVSKAESLYYQYNPFADFSDFNVTNAKILDLQRLFDEFPPFFKEHNIATPAISNYNNKKEILIFDSESLKQINSKLIELEQKLNGTKAISQVAINNKTRYQELLSTINLAIEQRKQAPVKDYNKKKNDLEIKINEVRFERKNLQKNYSLKLNEINSKLNNPQNPLKAETIPNQVTIFINQTKELSFIGSFYARCINSSLNEQLFRIDHCYQPAIVSIGQEKSENPLQKVVQKVKNENAPLKTNAKEIESYLSEICYILLNDTQISFLLNYYNALYILLTNIFQQPTIDQNSTQTILYEPIVEHCQYICTQSITLLKEIESKLLSDDRQKKEWTNLKNKFTDLLTNLKNKEKAPSNNSLPDEDKFQIKKEIEKELINQQNTLILEFENLQKIRLEEKKTPAQMEQHFLKSYSHIITVLTHYALIERLELNKYTNEKQTELTIENTKLQDLINTMHEKIQETITQLKVDIKEKPNISWNEELILHATIIELATMFYHIIDKCILNVFKKDTFFGEYLTLEKDRFKDQYNEIKNLLTNDLFFGDKIIETICEPKYKYCVDLFNQIK
ncbi:hypothetical protein EKK58_03420 [Candidatus Dependentiae bacterium]|nr:MAG: hypothetical protein EKK58_03420 [Candidatus Dependentiae bacterium]